MFNRLNNPSHMLSRLSALRAVGAREGQHRPMTTVNKPKPDLSLAPMGGPRGAAALDLLLYREERVFAKSSIHCVSTVRSNRNLPHDVHPLCSGVLT